MIKLDSEPVNWVQLMQDVYMEDGMHFELFDSDLGLVVAANFEGDRSISWFALTPDQWDDLLQESVEHY